MEPKVKIIGVAGLPRSGKDTVANLFVKKGFFGISLGDIVRTISHTRHKDAVDSISVANMTETSNWLRSVYGPDFALKKALNHFNDAQENGGRYLGLVVWSVRAPIEVDFILNHDGQLIWVEASDEIRYRRAISNLREGEAKISIDEFKAQEALQWQPQPNVPPKVQMDISYVKSKATKQLVNNSNNLEDFNRQVDEMIISLSSPSSDTN
jgi:dephospho-CoA kinase